jgi:hypothetical protein
MQKKKKNPNMLLPGCELVSSHNAFVMIRDFTDNLLVTFPKTMAS